MKNHRDSDIRDIGHSGKGNIEFRGEYSLGWNCIIDTSGGITVGERVNFGRECMIYTHRHKLKEDWWGKRDMIEYNGLTIGNDAFIGARAIILPQVNYIGEGVIIGAGAVVAEPYLPSNTTWVGNPAKNINGD